LSRGRPTICYDDDAFSASARGGIAKLFAQLVTSVERFECEVDLPFRYSINEHYFELGGNRLVKLPRFRGNARACRVLNSLMLKWPSAYNIWHATYYNTGKLHRYHRSGRALVVTIHDMIPELLSEHFSTNPHLGKQELASAADLIIAVSENTKKDVVRLYGMDPSKIVVIHPGIDIESDRVEEISVPDDFALFVGSRRGYKNFARLIEAFRKAQEQGAVFKLVCVGGGPFSTAEMDLLRSLPNGDVLQISATDAQLRYLFNKALFFVNPSLYEGFGFTLVEAMAQNCPLVVSRASSFPEVAGEAAIYFDPANVESMAEALEVASHDVDVRKRNAARGSMRVKEFSSSLMVERTVDSYRRLA